MSTWGSNVSEPLTELIGREAELERTHARLEASRWLTVLGPAGVGKSRFLLALAAGIRPKDAPGGVWRCSLSGADGEDEVCARIAAVLPSSNPRALPQDGAALARLFVDPIVLILDDAEHAVSVLSVWLPRWLSGAPMLRCLIGTRERLGGSGEHVVRLEPLHPDDAAQLFEQRAETARGAPLRPEERELVGALIERLDRLPLALELAAAQLAALSARDLLDSLDRHALRLASPDRAAVRHASLEAALDLSWELLEPPQREALGALALFESELDLAGIGAVVDDAPTILAALADRSWLQVDAHEEGHRYRLLGVVRTYVREHSDPDRAPYVAFVLLRARELLERWGERSSTIALCRFAADVGAAMDASPAHALELALILARVATARGPVPETLARLDALLDTHPPTVDLLLARGRLRARNAEPEASHDDYARALELADAGGDDEGGARAAASLADHLRHHGDAARAEQLYRRALATLDEPRSRARLTASLAGLVAERGDLEEAETLYAQAVASARAAGDVVAEAAALQNFGLLLQERGELDRAESMSREALALHTALGHRRFEAIAHLDLAGLALERVRPLDARREAEAASELAHRAGDRREHAIARLLRAVSLAMLDEDAAPAFAEATSLLEKLDEPGLLSALAYHRAHLILDSDLVGARAVLAEPAEGDDARLARRILRAALRRVERSSREVSVMLDGSQLRLPSGERVDLSSRAVLCAIVACLAEGLRRGDVVSADALIEAGWGDRATTKAAKNRLHVALATLRKLGLAEHLERSADGYRLVDCHLGGSDA